MLRDAPVKECLGSRRARGIHPGNPKVLKRIHQRCVRPTSATHISKTSTRAGPGFQRCKRWRNRVISRHSIRFARLTLATGRALDHSRRESVEALTSVSADDRQRKTPKPLAQDHFPRQPVKTEGFHSPGRLPPASSPPQTLPPNRRCRRSGSRRPFAPSGFPPGTRPPSPIPAATRMVSLSLTPLADFYNQNRTRAHRSDA